MPASPRFTSGSLQLKPGYLHLQLRSLEISLVLYIAFLFSSSEEWLLRVKCGFLRVKPVPANLQPGPLEYRPCALRL